MTNINELIIHIRKYYPSIIYFPRDALHMNGNIPLRVSLDNIANAQEFFNMFKENAYISLFSDWQIRNNTYDTIFIDIDGKTTEEAYEKYLKVNELLQEYKLIRRYFSGVGFHIFLDYIPTKIQNYHKTIRACAKTHNLLVQWTDKELLIDTQVMDTRRLCRVPGTINSDTSLYYIPFVESDTLEKILKRAQQKNVQQTNSQVQIQQDFINEGLEKKLQQIDNYYTNIKNIASAHRHVVQSSTLLNDIDTLPECMQNMIKQAKILGELTHIERIILATFLTKVWTNDKIQSLFAQIFKDYDSNVTTYYLNYIRQNYEHTYTCTKINELPAKYCPHKKWYYCSYYQRTKNKQQ